MLIYRFCFYAFLWFYFPSQMKIDGQEKKTVRKWENETTIKKMCNMKINFSIEILIYFISFGYSFIRFIWYKCDAYDDSVLYFIFYVSLDNIMLFEFRIHFRNVKQQKRKQNKTNWSVITIVITIIMIRYYYYNEIDKKNMKQYSTSLLNGACSCIYFLFRFDCICCCWKFSFQNKKTLQYVILHFHLIAAAATAVSVFVLLLMWYYWVLLFLQCALLSTM